MTESAARRAARVLLVDGRGRLLLFHGRDPARPDLETWWFTVGGGVREGESDPEAAARELFEETGLRCEPEALGDAVFEDEATFEFGGRRITQRQKFFMLRVAAHAVDTSRFEELEASAIVGHRWWTLDDLQRTADRVYPEGLAALFARLR